jgi:hypothetical protein
MGNIDYDDPLASTWQPTRRARSKRFAYGDIVAANKPQVCVYRLTATAALAAAALVAAAAAAVAAAAAAVGLMCGGQCRCLSNTVTTQCT